MKWRARGGLGLMTEHMFSSYHSYVPACAFLSCLNDMVHYVTYVCIN